jgi:hypothetical protein
LLALLGDAESLWLRLAVACRAVEVYNTPKFESMRKQCIQQDLSWAKPARVWEHSLDNMYNLPASQPVPLDSMGQPLYVPVEPRATLAGTAPPPHAAGSLQAPGILSMPAAAPPKATGGLPAIPAPAPKLSTVVPASPEPSAAVSAGPPRPTPQGATAPAAPSASTPAVSSTPPPPVTVVGPAAAKAAQNGAVDAKTAASAAPAADGAVSSLEVAPPIPSAVSQLNGAATEEATAKVEQELAAAETPVNRLRQEGDGAARKSEVEAKAADPALPPKV